MIRPVLEGGVNPSLASAGRPDIFCQDSPSQQKMVFLILEWPPSRHSGRTRRPARDRWRRIPLLEGRPEDGAVRSRLSGFLCRRLRTGFASACRMGPCGSASIPRRSPCARYGRALGRARYRVGALSKSASLAGNKSSSQRSPVEPVIRASRAPVE